MLQERQLKAIGMLVEGGHTITFIAEDVGVSRKTLYSWMKRDDFKAKLSEMQEIKNEILRENVKGNAEHNVRVLEELRDSSKNDMVRYNSANQLLNYAGWQSNQTHEIHVKTDDSEGRNYMLELLNKKKAETDDRNESDDEEEPV